MMEDISVLDRPGILVNNRKTNESILSKYSPARTHNNHIPGYLVKEGGESFVNYLKWRELDKDPNILVLSSTHHYYYDVDELKGISTLVNLKRLNFMNHLESYLHVVGEILSPDARFIGCFSDRKTKNGSGIPVRIYKRLVDFLDNRTDNEIDSIYLSRIFESCGFRIINMTEINGLTFFTTRKKGN